MKMFEDASVSVKVALAPLVAMVCLVGVALVGVGTAHQLTGTLRSLDAATLPMLGTIADLQDRASSAFARTNQSLAWTGAEFPPARIEALDKALAKELDALAASKIER